MWEGKRLIRSTEVSIILGVSVRQLQDWRAAGMGPPFYQYNARVIAYDENEVKAWQAEQHRLASKPNGGGRPPQGVKEVNAAAALSRMSEERGDELRRPGPAAVGVPDVRAKTRKKKKRKDRTLRA
jgi:predicted DNA-binding transcriptional regulator AlpA